MLDIKSISPHTEKNYLCATESLPRVSIICVLDGHLVLSLKTVKRRWIYSTRVGLIINNGTSIGTEFVDEGYVLEN